MGKATQRKTFYEENSWKINHSLRIKAMGCGRREQGEQLLPQSLRVKFTMGLLPQSFGKKIYEEGEML